MRVKAKICGLRRADDAGQAVEAGADFLGIVLDHGPRQASDKQIRDVVTAAADVPVLAVVVHSAVADVLRRRDRTGFSGVQLHGGQDDGQAAEFQREGLLVWRTARLAADSDTPDPARLAVHADAVLVEPWVPDAAGGSGRALDLARAARIRQRLRPGAMVLAGGLTAESVAAAARSVAPYAVDVSSGVEAAPGVKDPELVARFLEALRGIESDG
jgi:phosphoribosylanthranilate isomerase